MKILKSIVILIITAAVLIAFITLRPSKSEFAEYYVEQNETGLGEFFDNALEKLVLEETTEKEYLVFSVFEVDSEDRYVGVLGHFFGRSTTEQAVDTLQRLLQRVKETVN